MLLVRWVRLLLLLPPLRAWPPHRCQVRQGKEARKGPHGASGLGGASGGGGGSSIADLSGDLSDGAVEKVVDDLFSDEVRFSDDDDEEEEEEEELTSRSRGKGKGKANGTRNKRAAPSKLPGRKAASKKKKTKAAKEYGFRISDLERMRGRGGTALTTGIKGSAGLPARRKQITPCSLAPRCVTRCTRYSGCPAHHSLPQFKPRFLLV